MLRPARGLVSIFPTKLFLRADADKYFTSQRSDVSFPKISPRTKNVIKKKKKNPYLGDFIISIHRSTQFYYRFETGPRKNIIRRILLISNEKKKTNELLIIRFNIIIVC